MPLTQTCVSNPPFKFISLTLLLPHSVLLLYPCILGTSSPAEFSSCKLLCRSTQDLTFVVDNTFAPLVVSPARWGVDVVVQSLTKYVSGAADIIAGGC